MSRKSGKKTPDTVADTLGFLLNTALASDRAVQESPERQAMAAANERFAAVIIETMDQAAEIEDLVKLNSR
ncbi:MAG: hypothetical protein LBU23_07540 [Planctomycetota bacterium]|jgi:hypothetical protein|nr:hypothetical protein [Planctomycetota bacterium]